MHLQPQFIHESWWYTVWLFLLRHGRGLHVACGDPITINSPSHVWHYFNLFQFCHSPNYYIDIEKLGYIYHFNSCPCMSYKEISMGFQFLYMTSYNVIWNLLHKSLYILAINSFALTGLKHGKWWKIKKHFDRPGYLTDLNK